MDPTPLSAPTASPEPLSAAHRSSQRGGRIARLAVGVAAGGLLGIGMYFLVGCTSGCAFLSSPILSTLYGALVGGVAAYR